jgi:hypothetical protein
MISMVNGITASPHQRYLHSLFMHGSLRQQEAFSYNPQKFVLNSDVDFPLSCTSKIFIEQMIDKIISLKKNWPYIFISNRFY